MQLVVVNEQGGPEVLKLEERPTPQPGAGQALVKVAAVGVNFQDIYRRSGLYKVPLPFYPGSEGAGVVTVVGPGVTEVKPGDRVAWLDASGSYASEAIIAADKLMLLPQGLSFEAAAAVMLQGLTAYVLTHEAYRLQPGESCLVHAAAGGVGLLLCQMAKMIGARVIGTTSTEAKAEKAREAGANEVILYTTQDFESEVKRITGNKGVQVVYDSVGKDTFDKSLNCLATRGYMVLFGQSSGLVPLFDIQRLSGPRSLFLTRPMLFDYVRDRAALQHHSNVLLDWVLTGRLKVHIHRAYPLTQVAESHKALASRQTTGKLLLVP